MRDDLIKALYKLLLLGAPRLELERKIVEFMPDVSPTQFDELIALAQGYLENLFQANMHIHDFKAALAVQKQLNELLRLNDQKTRSAPGRRPGARNLRRAIYEHGGLIADIARHFDVTRQTIYNWLDHYQMRELIIQARQSMREVAKDVIYQRLMSEDENAAFEAARFVMLRLQSDGELLTLSPETLALLGRMGLDVMDVVTQFESMVREAAQKGLTDE